MVQIGPPGSTEQKGEMQCSIGLFFLSVLFLLFCQPLENTFSGVSPQPVRRFITLCPCKMISAVLDV